MDAERFEREVMRDFLDQHVANLTVILKFCREHGQVDNEATVLGVIGAVNEAREALVAGSTTAVEVVDLITAQAEMLTACAALMVEVEG